MPKHVLSFHPDGSVEYTRNSSFTVFGGMGDMHRVTDIGKMSYGNFYYIRWLMGPYAGMVHTVSMARNYGVEVPPRPAGDEAISPIMTFPAYEDAVSHEVDVLNAMRIRGVKFHDEQT